MMGSNVSNRSDEYNFYNPVTVKKYSLKEAGYGGSRVRDGGSRVQDGRGMEKRQSKGKEGKQEGKQESRELLNIS